MWSFLLPVCGCGNLHTVVTNKRKSVFQIKQDVRNRQITVNPTTPVITTWPQTINMIKHRLWLCNQATLPESALAYFFLNAQASDPTLVPGQPVSIVFNLKISQAVTTLRIYVTLQRTAQQIKNVMGSPQQITSDVRGYLVSLFSSEVASPTTINVHNDLAEMEASLRYQYPALTQEDVGYFDLLALGQLVFPGQKLYLQHEVVINSPAPTSKTVEVPLVFSLNQNFAAPNPQAAKQKWENKTKPTQVKDLSFKLKSSYLLNPQVQTAMQQQFIKQQPSNLRLEWETYQPFFQFTINNATLKYHLPWPGTTSANQTTGPDALYLAILVPNSLLKQKFFPEPGFEYSIFLPTAKISKDSQVTNS